MTISLKLLKRYFVLVGISLVIASCGAGSTKSTNQPPDNSSTQTLNVSITGSGTVSSLGINCSSDCTQQITTNQSMSLTATANAGFVFSEWTGACSGSASCDITMDGEKNVTAIFLPSTGSTFTLTVQANAGGSIISSPSGINCGSACSTAFNENTLVTLTALPNPGFVLEQWSDDCTGNTNCQVTLSQNKNVTASFVAGSLSISPMGRHTVAHGNTFQFQPTIIGGFTICRKDLGHDDVKVDSETGAITWDTSALNFGRGFHIRIKCSNVSESVFASLVVHVDKSGASQIRVAGENGVSPYIGVAAQAMASGDTIVFPDGHYPVSVTADASYENALKSTAPTNGSSEQYSTIMAESPGGVIIDGAPHDGIGKQKNAFQLSPSSYVAIAGFVVKNVQRESFTTTGGASTKLLLDFIGAQGAGTNLQPCSNFSEASSGLCSNAGMRVNSGSPLIQNSYDWGHNRYGIMTRSTNGSITRRSFVRLDEHKGDQPYGGFSNYCDTLHLSQDNTVFDSLAIAAPHYKNYAGLEAYPATGCENVAATLKTEGLLAVNNHLSLSLMDVKAGPTHIWDGVVSYDSQGTCTPQTNRCGLWLLQADKTVDVSNSFFGKARGFEGGTSPGIPFGNNINLAASVIIDDVSGVADTVQTPTYLPESQLYFRGRSDTFHGDNGYDTLTNARRWPIPGEDIMAANMRSYRNQNALKVGGGTVDVNGDRGAVASGESMSEYFWGYINDKVPPLVVRVKDKTTTHRVAWEHLTGSKRALVTGWKVICVSAGNAELANLAVNQLIYIGDTSCSQYGVKAVYNDGDSGIAYTEQAE